MSRQPLLLISRRDLIDASEGKEGERMLRHLSALTRQGYHFVATASQPEEWSRSKAVSKRSRPGPKRIRDRLADFGGILDGLYYIPQSLLTQRTRREEALTDLLCRFGTKSKHCYLFSSNRKFLSTAKKLGIKASKISEKHRLVELIDRLHKRLD